MICTGKIVEPSTIDAMGVTESMTVLLDKETADALTLVRTM